MTRDWVDYEVGHRDADLAALLARFGLADGDDDADLAERVWMDARNRVGRPPDRPRFQLVPGERVWLPPRELTPDRAVRAYTFTGREPDLAAVCDAIRARHGVGALEPLPDDPAALTPESLYARVENVPFAKRHPEGPRDARGFVAGEEIFYEVRVRTFAVLSVAPSPAGSPGASGTNTVVTGDPVFRVKVALTTPKVVTWPMGSDRTLRKAKVRFSVTIEKTTTLDPKRVTIGVWRAGQDPDKDPAYYREEYNSGAWLKPGKHEFAWDGFSSGGELDTRILRGRLTVVVTVEAERGRPGKGRLYLKNRAAHATFVEMKVSIPRREVEVEAFLKFDRIDEHWIFWVAAPLVFAVGAAGAYALQALALWGTNIVRTRWANLPPVEGNQQWMLTAAGVVGFLTMLLEGVATRLPDDEYQHVRGLVLSGVGRFWSRTGPKAVTIDGQKYAVRVRASERETDAVLVALMRPAYPKQRGVNLSMIGKGLPVIVSYTKGEDSDGWIQEVGAHEFGHSVLERARGSAHSIEHKGTTGGVLDQSPNANAPSYPPLVYDPVVGGMVCREEVDLMKYYKDKQRDLQHAQAIIAVEEDVIGLLTIPRVAWHAQ